MITTAEVRKAFEVSANALKENANYLVELDQQVGDGDLGITAGKISDAIHEFNAQNQDENDIGKFLMGAGMKINSAASSTMGSLLAIALMRAGKTVKEQTAMDEKTLAGILETASNAIQEKGKAEQGDKTILDALIPGVNAFSESIHQGNDLKTAGREMLTAAVKGLESATPLRSQVGRASWVGDRTEGKVDPGCALLVIILRSIIK